MRNVFAAAQRMGVVCVICALVVCGSASADIIIDVNGTPDNATLTASVTNDDVFITETGTGILTFHLAPNTFDIHYVVSGPKGTSNPWVIRAPSDVSYINSVNISTGDLSVVVLNKNNPITTSVDVSGAVTSLAALDGVTSLMNRTRGIGPNTNITVNYNIIPEPASLALLGVGGLLLVRSRR